MTVYMKVSNGIADGYYFTDGANMLSENFTFIKACKQAKFLESLGIKIERRF